MPSRPNAQARGEVVSGTRRQRLVEELRGPGLEVAALRAADAGAQRPERPALAVVGADVLEPAAVEAHEVAEPALLARRTQT